MRILGVVLFPVRRKRRCAANLNIDARTVLSYTFFYMMNPVIRQTMEGALDG